MDEAHELCDRVGIIDQGKLIALGTPRELVASLGAEHVVEFAVADGVRIDDQPFAALPGVRDVRRDDAAHLHSVDLRAAPDRAGAARLPAAARRGAEPARHPQRDARGRLRDADREAAARWIAADSTPSAPGRARPNPLVELTLSRLREFLREPEAVFWVFAFPVIMTCALGIAFRSRGDEPVIVGVVEQPGADEIAAALERSGGFTVRRLPPETSIARCATAARRS